MINDFSLSYEIFQNTLWMRVNIWVGFKASYPGFGGVLPHQFIHKLYTIHFDVILFWVGTDRFMQDIKGLSLSISCLSNPQRLAAESKNWRPEKTSNSTF